MENASRTETTTAADMQPIVDAGRAEGLDALAIVSGWLKAARPNVTVQTNHCDGEIVAMWDGKQLWFSDLGEEFSCEAGESIGGATFESESLAENMSFLANQLRERCPVAAMTPENADCYAFPEHAAYREWRERYFGSSEAAALIRRQYAISEPEVGA